MLCIKINIKNYAFESTKFHNLQNIYKYVHNIEKIILLIIDSNKTIRKIK